MFYEVHHRRRPAWEVGEGTLEHVPGAHYHDDYKGKVLGVRRCDSDRPSLRHMADEARGVVDIDLTDEQVTGLRNRALKITESGLEDVTVDDRWGRAATILRERGLDPAGWEADSRAAFDEAERANELEEMRFEAERSVYQDRLVASVISGEPLPVRPLPPVRIEPRDEFTAEAVKVARALPPPDVSTGTGLYAVRAVPDSHNSTLWAPPTDNGDGTWNVRFQAANFDASWNGGYVNNNDRGQLRSIVAFISAIIVRVEGDCSTWQHTDDATAYDAWSTIQAALDQLWTDQSTVTFAASQYIRIFAGTYDENVAPNTGLVPDITGGYALVLEGDPTDSRANVIIAASAGNYGIFFNVITGPITTRHLTIAGAVVNTLFRWDGDGHGYLLDCVLDASAAAAHGISHASNALHLHVWDCNVTISDAARSAMLIGAGTSDVRRCTIKGPGKATSAGYGIYGYSLRRVEGCTISGFRYALRGFFYYDNPVEEGLLNSTIYDCTYGWCNYRIHYEWMAAPRLINNVFSAVNYPLMFDHTWPEENDYFGPWLTLRNNVFFNYTALAYRLSDGATKTYAEIAAMNQVDAAGDLDATDPLLTDPGAGDFSLQAASPCRHAGHGSGVVSDYLGTAFDPYNPDIGGWSSGTFTGPLAPSVTAADDETGNSFTVTIVAASTEDELDTYHVRYRQAPGGSWAEFGTTRVGSGTIQVTGLGTHRYEFEVLAERFTYRYGPPSDADHVLVTTGATASVEEAVRQVLLDDVTVSGLVSDRVYAGDAAQSPVEPYVVYMRTSSAHQHHMGAASGLAFTRMEVTYYAEDYATVKALALAAREALQGYDGTVTTPGGSLALAVTLESDTDGYRVPWDGSQEGTHRVIHEYLVRHAETVPTFA